MNLNAKDYPPGSSCFSFVAEDGTNIHVDSERLRKWCAENRERLKVVPTPIDKRIAKSFLHDNVVDAQHVERVLAMEALDPIIYGMTRTEAPGEAPDVLLIDGHHRYVAGAVVGATTIAAYLLEPEQWEPFRIGGLPTLSKEQLMLAPIKPRTPKGDSQ